VVPRNVRPKSLRQLLIKAEIAGCVITVSNSGHLKIVTPSGQIYFCAKSASDYRAERNVRSALRKYGVPI